MSQCCQGWQAAAWTYGSLCSCSCFSSCIFFYFFSYLCLFSSSPAISPTSFIVSASSLLLLLLLHLLLLFFLSQLVVVCRMRWPWECWPHHVQEPPSLDWSMNSIAHLIFNTFNTYNYLGSNICCHLLSYVFMFYWIIVAFNTFLIFESSSKLKYKVSHGEGGSCNAVWCLGQHGGGLVWQVLQCLWPSSPNCRDGKSLQNSTDITLSLNNFHTKYVQKMLKIVQKQAKIPKISKKKSETFK